MLFRDNKANLFKKHINLFKPRKLFKNRSFFAKKNIEEIGKFNIKDFENVNEQKSLLNGKVREMIRNINSKKVGDTITLSTPKLSKRQYSWYLLRNSAKQRNKVIIKNLEVKENNGFVIYGWQNSSYILRFTLFNDPDYNFMYIVNFNKLVVYSESDDPFIPKLLTFQKIMKNASNIETYINGRDDNQANKWDFLVFETSTFFEEFKTKDYVKADFNYVVDYTMNYKLSIDSFIDNNLYLDNKVKCNKNYFDEIINFSYDKYTNIFTSNLKTKLFGAAYLKKDLKNPINGIDFEIKFKAYYQKQTIFNIQLNNEILFTSYTDYSNTYLSVPPFNEVKRVNNNIFSEYTVEVGNKTGELLFIIGTMDDNRDEWNNIELELKNIEIHYCQQDSLKTTIKDYNKKEVIGDERIGRISPPPKRIIVKGFND